jgi:hypothetical protein
MPTKHLNEKTLIKNKTMIKNYLIEETSGSISKQEVEMILKDDFLTDLYENTFFSQSVIDELEDYLIQNKLTIVKTK